MEDIMKHCNICGWDEDDGAEFSFSDIRCDKCIAKENKKWGLQ